MCSFFELRLRKNLNSSLHKRRSQLKKKNIYFTITSRSYLKPRGPNFQSFLIKQTFFFNLATFQLLDPKDSESIILVREAGGRVSRRSQNGPKGRDDRYRVKEMEELDAQALADREQDLDLDSSYILEQESVDERTGQRTRRRIYHSRKTPIEKGKIFKV